MHILCLYLIEAHPVATLLEIHKLYITIKSCYVCDWRNSSEVREWAAFPEISAWFLALTWWLTTLSNSNYRGMWHSLLASMDPGIHVVHRHTSKQNIQAHIIKKITTLLEMALFCLLKAEVCYQELIFWGV